MSGTAVRRRRGDARAVWRSFGRWWAQWAAVIARCAAAAGIALAGYLAFFTMPRPVTVDIGRFPDRLVLSGFNGDERDNGVTYRWTTTAARIAIPGYGGVRAARVEVVARNGRGTAAAVPFTVDLGETQGRLAAAARFTAALDDLLARVGGAGLVATLGAERYTPEGNDPRILGVQVDRVRIEPLAVEWWPGARGGWPWAARLALLAVAVALVVPRPWGGALGGGAAAAIAFACFALPESRLILAPLLVPGAGAVAAVGGAVRWRDLATVLAGVWDALDRPAVARGIVGALVVAFTLFTVAVIWRVDFIGHADYADNAVRARSIVQGLGDTIPYVPQFYERLPNIARPAETWPPLQPWLIAVFFVFFGISTAVAKLPNVLLMAGLIALTAWIGAWRWSRRVGVLAALLLALTPLFFEYTIYPVNDLGFTFLFALFVVAAYRAWCAPRGQARARWRAVGPWLPEIAVGVAAGLLMLAKPSGAVLVAGAGVTALLLNRRAGQAVPWRGCAIAAGVAALVYAPWAIRNLVTFGVPLHTTESLDVWILKYDPTQPTEGIYRVFFGRNLPHPRLLIGYGYDHFLNVQWQQFVRLWADLSGGALVPRLLLPFVALGLLLGASRRPGLGALLAGAAISYTLFIQVYWHYELRYFVVFAPWLLLYAASGIEWLSDALAVWFAAVWQRALVPLLVAALLLAVIVPQAQEIGVRAEANTGGNQAVVLAKWLEANTPPDAVIMTRNPWEIAWHSNRRTVMLPLGTRAEIDDVIRQYNVTVLALDRLNDTSLMRESLRPLYSFKELPGITPRYDPGDNTFLIFDVQVPR